MISPLNHLIFILSNKKIFGWTNSYIHKQPKKIELYHWKSNNIY
ncbi:hypothetical protein HMP0015_0013 [Acinetobacter haemolyticus ATCC 19194]|uniref:Uncharacterized protein n=1 Tax=Acinetobacter haemolyticus ATCC 19194 TaxID=707232 RepID=D4XJX1_ACIHA|nr:hypothetical protein HMP0015_0013 [Acinetobacter haemolyticus ATCC 19194]